MITIKLAANKKDAFEALTHEQIKTFSTNITIILATCSFHEYYDRIRANFTASGRISISIPGVYTTARTAEQLSEAISHTIFNAKLSLIYHVQSITIEQHADDEIIHETIHTDLHKAHKRMLRTQQAIIDTLSAHTHPHRALGICRDCHMHPPVEIRIREHHSDEGLRM